MGQTILSMKLMEYRSVNNLTQGDLAKKLAVNPQEVFNWEAGITYPNNENMLVLSQISGLSLEYLLLEKQDKNKETIEKSIKNGLIACIIMFAVGIVFYWIIQIVRYSFSGLTIGDFVNIFLSGIFATINTSTLLGVLVGGISYLSISSKNKKQKYTNPPIYKNQL